MLSHSNMLSFLTSLMEISNSWVAPYWGYPAILLLVISIFVKNVKKIHQFRLPYHNFQNKHYKVTHFFENYYRSFYSSKYPSHYEWCLRWGQAILLIKLSDLSFGSNFRAFNTSLWPALTRRKGHPGIFLLGTPFVFLWSVSKNNWLQIIWLILWFKFSDLQHQPLLCLNLKDRSAWDLLVRKSIFFLFCVICVICGLKESESFTSRNESFCNNVHERVTW